MVLDYRAERMDSKGYERVDCRADSEGCERVDCRADSEGYERVDCRADSEGCERFDCRADSEGCERVDCRADSEGCERVDCRADSEGYERFDCRADSEGCERVDCRADSEGCERVDCRADSEGYERVDCRADSKGYKRFDCRADSEGCERVDCRADSKGCSCLVQQCDLTNTTNSVPGDTSTKDWLAFHCLLASLPRLLKPEDISQVQEALEEAPNNSSGPVDCDLGSDLREWKESDASDSRFDSRRDSHSDSQRDSFCDTWNADLVSELNPNDEGSSSVLLGAEHLCTGQHVVKCPEAVECKQRAVKSTYCRECVQETQHSSTLNTVCKELNTQHRKAHSADTDRRHSHQIHTHDTHSDKLFTEHAITRNTEELKTPDTNTHSTSYTGNTPIAGKKCTEACSEAISENKGRTHPRLPVSPSEADFPNENCTRLPNKDNTNTHNTEEEDKAYTCTYREEEGWEGNKVADQTVNSPGAPEEAGLPPALAPYLLFVPAEGTRAEQRGSFALHTGTDSDCFKERQQKLKQQTQQWQTEHEFLLCSKICEDGIRNCEDVSRSCEDGIFLPSSQLSDLQVQVKNKCKTSFNKGCEQRTPGHGRVRGRLFEGRRCRKEEVSEENPSPCNLSLGPTSEARAVEYLTNHDVLKSHNPELQLSSSLTPDRDKSRHCLPVEEEEEEPDRSQEPVWLEQEEISVYLKQGQNVQGALCPLQSTIHIAGLSDRPSLTGISTEECVLSKPYGHISVETHDSISTECQPPHIQPTVGAEKQTPIIDLEHKTDVSLPHTDVTVTLHPGASTVKITVDPHNHLLEQDKLQSDQLRSCQRLLASSTPYSEDTTHTTNAVCVERFVSSDCEQWLGPFSDGAESDSESSDQTDSFSQGKSNHQTSDRHQGSFLQEFPCLPCPLGYKPQWSSEDSAVSELGEDFESIHCDFYLLQVANEETHQQKGCLDARMCLHSETSEKNTIKDLCDIQKSHVDPKPCADTHLLQFSHIRVECFKQSTHCKDNQHTHIHPSLCGICLQEASIDSSSSQPSQPLCKVLEPATVHLGARGLLQQDKVDDIYHPSQASSDWVNSQNSIPTQSPTRHSHTEGDPVLLYSQSLEPIPETERCSDKNPLPKHPVDEISLGQEEMKEVQTRSRHMKPAETEQDILRISSDTLILSRQNPPVFQSCAGELDGQPCPASTGPNRAVVLLSDQSIPTEGLATAHLELDASSITSEDPVGQPTSSSTSVRPHKAKAKTSKFSVFRKMPSFRRGKSLGADGRGSKGEKLPMDSPDRGLDLLLYRRHLSQAPELGRGTETPADDSDDDDIFYRSDALKNPVHQVMCGSRVDMEEEVEGDICATSETSICQEGCVQGLGEAEVADLKQSSGSGGSGYRRSKSSEGLSLRLRFAQAHKSLSGLFESRSMDRDSEEPETQPGLAEVRAKPSWRKQKRAKEAELLRRTQSEPERERGGAKATRVIHSDYASRTAQERLCLEGVLTLPQTQCCTDPLSKRSVGSSPQGCKSEGRRRKCPPNGFSVALSDTGRLSSDDSSEALPPGDSSPLSPMRPLSLTALTNQIPPTSSKSPSGTSESASTESPMRPMSPKPSSPRSAGARRSFRYPSSRANALSLILLGPGVSVIDPPERPRTLKPKVGRQGSLSPLGFGYPPEDINEDSWSQASLVTSVTVSESELKIEAFFLEQMCDYSVKSWESSTQAVFWFCFSSKQIAELGQTKCALAESPIGLAGGPRRQAEGAWSEKHQVKTGKKQRLCAALGGRVSQGPAVDLGPRAMLFADLIFLRQPRTAVNTSSPGSTHRSTQPATLLCPSLMPAFTTSVPRRDVRRGSQLPRRRCCSDDLWVEEEKRRKRKLAVVASKLCLHPTEQPEEVRVRLSHYTVQVFPGSLLKALSFSHSTPIGLDCPGWRQCMPHPCE
ncbi:hypothetical protein P4O66_010060 [Electrophorus voltai]|uniref:Uncharacterized protein n=1 Tax=Electrophorus voltai TaxID=2609070 RepID=A0AAD8Z994_9TELE|nr:hypothetical protein P4O66_010060 [Electrophorus voltai]